MDVSTLVPGLVSLLAPLLPYLVKAGEHAAEEAGKKLGGGATWEFAKNIWQKLRPPISKNQSAAEAVQGVIEAPKDEDAQAVLRVQLRKLLHADPALAQEVQALYKNAERAGVTVNVSGEGAVGIGGDVHNSRIVTGDGDYAEGNMDKRSGAFVSGGEVRGSVVGQNYGTMTSSYDDAESDD